RGTPWAPRPGSRWSSCRRPRPRCRGAGSAGAPAAPPGALGCRRSPRPLGPYGSSSPGTRPGNNAPWSPGRRSSAHGRARRSPPAGGRRRARRRSRAALASSQDQAGDGGQPLGRLVPAPPSVERSEDAPVLGAARDKATLRREAAGVDVVAEPRRQAVAAALERGLSVDLPTIEGGAAAARTGRRRDEHRVVARGDRAQIVSVHPLGEESPRSPAVSTDAESFGGGGHHDLGARGVREHLVDVALDVDRRRPGPPAVARAYDAA